MTTRSSAFAARIEAAVGQHVHPAEAGEGRGTAAGAEPPADTATAFASSPFTPPALAPATVPGAVWWVRRGETVATGAAGTHGPGDPRPLRPDTVFRISSMTKPIVAAAAMALVDDGALDLDGPVDDLLPELAGRRVLVDPTDPTGPTVPARRPITVRDLLEFRLGLGMDFTGPWPNPFLELMAGTGLPPGPPAPQAAPPPDEWMRRLGTLPLAHQPGERWLYHTGASVLGVLMARASGRALPDLLAERILEPLGMRSTGFGVPAHARDRLGPHWAPHDQAPDDQAPDDQAPDDQAPDQAPDDEAPDEQAPADQAPADQAPDAGFGLRLYDPADGQWAHPPAFPDGGDGLVSTAADVAAFAAMLCAGGTSPAGERVLSEGAVRAMLTDGVGPVDAEGGGWGLGLGVRRVDEPGGRHAGAYGWDGGMGSTWWTDPVTDVAAILLTNLLWSSSGPPAVFDAFRAAAFGDDVG